MTDNIKSDGHEFVRIYSIKDLAVDAFGASFEARSDLEACRMVSHMLSTQPDNLLSLFSSEYQLFRLAELNRHTGVVSPAFEYLAPVANLPRAEQPSLFDQDSSQEADRSHKAGAAS